MTVEFDPVVDAVLSGARAAVSPAPAEIAHAFAGVQRRLGQPVAELHESPNAPAAVSSAGVPLAALRRLLGTALTLGLGFAIGVHYARQDSTSGGAAPLEGSPQRAASSLQAPARAVSAAEPPPAGPPAAQLPAIGQRPVELPSVETRVGLQPAAKSELRASANGKPRSRPRLASNVAAAEPKVAPRESGPLDFAAVLERVSLAQREQRDFSPEAALRVLDELDARADAETLRDERLVTRVLAACDVGDVPAASRAARELSKSPGPSVYASRVASSCVASGGVVSGAATPALSPPGSR